MLIECGNNASFVPSVSSAEIMHLCEHQPTTAEYHTTKPDMSRCRISPRPPRFGDDGVEARVLKTTSSGVWAREFVRGRLVGVWWLLSSKGQKQEKRKKKKEKRKKGK